ncbi:hypothetical protein ACFCZY_37565 [Streptomyces sp. NPDC056237]|uniref:hypothetical protein n=1 Tax=unclassified Streptomyces TaxID=2593676 RepID=UPI0035E05CF4
MTAAVLTGAGFGTPLSWQTEIAHKLPYGYTQYADLTMRAPNVDVPAMLPEVDRVNEPVDVLVDKVRRYNEWFELLAPKADKTKAHAARRDGAAVHDFRLWSRIYPATGDEGYVPLAFVFTGKTKAQRASRMRRLEQAARGTKYPGAGITAVDYHQAVPVVVTELERITADPDGAAGKVWRRLGRDEWQTLTEALDNPDGDRLYVVQREQARKRQVAAAGTRSGSTRRSSSTPRSRSPNPSERSTIFLPGRSRSSTACSPRGTRLAPSLRSADHRCRRLAHPACRLL